ncbi:unnamed protein product [Ascophyllum nodosum]
METDERRCSDTGIADAAAPVHPLSITHDVHQTIQGRTRRGTFGLAKAADLARNDYISHDGRTRARALSLDSPPGFARGEFFAYPGNRPDQTSTGAKPLKEEEQVVPILVPNLPTGPIRKEFAVMKETESPKSLENTARSLCASPEIQLTSGGEGKNDKHCSISGLATSTTLTPSPIIASGTTHVHQTIHSLTRARVITRDSAVDLVDNRISLARRTGARAIRFDSKVDLARINPSGYTGNQPNQASTGARRWEEDEQAVSRSFHHVPTAPTPNGVAVETKPASRESLGVVTDPRHTNRGRTRARAASLGSAADLRRYDHTSHGPLIRTVAFSLDSTAGVARDKSSGYADNKPNQALTGARRWKGDEQTVSRSFPSVPTAPAQNDPAVETKAGSRESLGDVAGAFSGFPGVQLTSVRQGTGGKHRRGTRVATSATLIASPIISHATIYDARYPIVGRTRATPSSHGSTADVVRDDHTRHVLHTRARPLSLDSAACSLPAKHLLYIGNQPKQALTDARRRKREEQGEPRSFQNVSTTFTKSNAVFKAKKEAQGSFGGVVVCPSPSGVQLISVRKGTDEKRPSGATHDTHGNTCRRPGASARCHGSAVRLAHNEPFGGYMRSHLSQESGDTKPDKEEKYVISWCPLHANTASAQRVVGVGTESELPGRLCNDHGIISVSSGGQLVSLGVGTGKRRPSRARVIWSPDTGRPHQDAGEGVGTTTSVTVVSPPFLTRDATHRIRLTIRGKTRASDRRHDSVADLERHEPRGYTYTGIQRNEDLNDTRSRNPEHVVRGYSRDVATVCTHKEPAVAMGAESLGFQGNVKRTISGLIDVQPTSPGGTTDERRADGTRDRCAKIDKYKLDADAGVGTRIAISANPKLSPISTHGTKYDASHTSRNRPKTRAFVPSLATGFTESWGVAGDQSLSGARGWNGHMEKGRGAVKVDLDADCVSEHDDLIPEKEEEEEGHHGRIYLPDSRFVGTLGVNPDSNSGGHGEFPTDGGVKPDNGKDDEALEYDMDDFEDYT